MTLHTLSLRAKPLISRRPHAALERSNPLTKGNPFTSTDPRLGGLLRAAKTAALAMTLHTLSLRAKPLISRRPHAALERSNPLTKGNPFTSTDPRLGGLLRAAKTAALAMTEYGRLLRAAKTAALAMTLHTLSLRAKPLISRRPHAALERSNPLTKGNPFTSTDPRLGGLLRAAKTAALAMTLHTLSLRAKPLISRRPHAALERSNPLTKGNTAV